MTDIKFEMAVIDKLNSMNFLLEEIAKKLDIDLTNYGYFSKSPQELLKEKSKA